MYAMIHRLCLYVSSMSATFLIIVLLIGTEYVDGCSQPQKRIHNTYIKSFDSQKTTYNVGETVEYICKTGFFHEEGSGVATCSVNNSGGQYWDGPALRCAPKTCPDPGSLEHGKVIGTLYVFGANITYACDDGYKPSTTRLRRFCTSEGKWSGLVPICNPVECPMPVDPEHGKADYNERTYGYTVKYVCGNGYMVEGKKILQCLADATWSGQPPKCVEVYCPRPSDYLPAGNVKLPKGFKIGSLVIYICDKGDIQLISTCREDGTWSQKPPHCPGAPTTTEPYDTTGSVSPDDFSTVITTATSDISGHQRGDICGKPPSVDNSKHDHPDDQERYDINVKVKYKCEDNCKTVYRNDRDMVATCTKVNGQVTWIGPNFTCKDCLLVYIIVGTVIGSLAFGVLLFVLVWFLKKRHRKSAIANGKQSGAQMNHEEAVSLNVQHS